MTSFSTGQAPRSLCCAGTKAVSPWAGLLKRNRTFFFGSYQATRANTSFVDEASNTRACAGSPHQRSFERGNRPIRHGDLEHFPERSCQSGRHQSDFEVSPAGAAPQRHVSGAVGLGRLQLRTREDQIAASCEVLSIIPATFEQDQFSLNLEHQVRASNRLSGKYFFSNQPSRDPLSDTAALTLHEVEETTYQRTLSITDVHAFGSGMLNELRAGFFRNRNDSMPVRYFSNADFGIANPFADQVPDLTQITIDGERCRWRASLRDAG